MVHAVCQKSVSFVLLAIATVGCGTSGDKESPRLKPEAETPDDIKTLHDLANQYNAVFDTGTFSFKYGHQGPSDTELAAIVAKLKDVKTPIALTIDHSKQLTPAGLATLKDAKCVNKLNLIMDGLKDAMPAIGQMTQLEQLFISDDTLVDDDLASLAKLTKLKKLTALSDKLTAGSYKYISNLTDLEELVGTVAADNQYTDADLANMKQLAKLKKLSIGVVKVGNVTDAGIAYLKGMTGLEQLSIRGAKMTPPSLDIIAGLPHLRELSLAAQNFATDFPFQPADFARLLPLKDQLKKLRYVAVGDDWLEHVGRLVALEELDIGGLKITDAGVAKLTGLQNLQWLELGNNNVTDEGVKKLATLSHLHSLNLKSNPITNAAVAHLKNNTTLDDLTLWETPVTDEIVPTIKAMPGLKKLDIRGTKMTKAAASDLEMSRKWQSFYKD